MLIYGSSARSLGRLMLGSTILMDVRRLNEASQPIFRRLYCYLVACKHGFVNSYKPMIGLDGCHLKRSSGGQFLIIVGKDGSENIFPIT